MEREIEGTRRNPEHWLYPALPGRSRSIDASSLQSLIGPAEVEIVLHCTESGCLWIDPTSFIHTEATLTPEGQANPLWDCDRAVPLPLLASLHSFFNIFHPLFHLLEKFYSSYHKVRYVVVYYGKEDARRRGRFYKIIFHN